MARPPLRASLYQDRRLRRCRCPTPARVRGCGVRTEAVNVALGTSPVTDFRRDLTVTTRNGSRNIRTFAGNDTIHRAASDPDCRIDGGPGVNTVVYPGRRADWVVARAGTRIAVAPVSGGGGTDSLTHVQKAQFDDITLDLTTLP